MKPTLKCLLFLSLSLGAARTCLSQDSLVIGSFDFQRSGQISIAEGGYFQQFRALLNANFSNVVFRSLDTLTSSNLACVGVLVLAPGTTHTTAAMPLSTNEQAALRDYVLHGGGGVILADNYSYAATATDEETALLSPFGLAGCCTLSGQVLATVQDPTSHPVTSGSFGTISSFGQYYPGGLTALGPYAVGLATNPLGVALAVINGDAMAIGSGRVAIYSDGNTFADDEDFGGITANQTLLLNTVAWCRPGSRRPALAIAHGGSSVVLRWPATALGFQLEAAASLGPAAVWAPVEGGVTVLGSDNVVTNALGAAGQFYRLACP